MKKLLLLSTVLAIAIGSGAQERQLATMPSGNVGDRKIDAAALQKYARQKNVGYAKKMTFTGGRWYNYGDAMDTSTNYNLEAITRVPHWVQ